MVWEHFWSWNGLRSNLLWGWGMQLYHKTNTLFALANSSCYTVRLVWFPRYMDWERRKHRWGCGALKTSREPHPLLTCHVHQAQPTPFGGLNTFTPFHVPLSHDYHVNITSWWCNVHINERNTRARKVRHWVAVQFTCSSRLNLCCTRISGVVVQSSPDFLSTMQS